MTRCDEARTLVDEAIARHAARGVSCLACVDGDEIFVDEIWRDRSDETTRGRGADLMNELCAIADRHGMRLELTHMADEAGLGPYYERFGLRRYEVPGGNPALSSMRRLPAAAPLSRD